MYSTVQYSTARDNYSDAMVPHLSPVTLVKIVGGMCRRAGVIIKLPLLQVMREFTIMMIDEFEYESIITLNNLRPAMVQMSVQIH